MRRSSTSLATLLVRSSTTARWETQDTQSLLITCAIPGVMTPWLPRHTTRPPDDIWWWYASPAAGSLVDQRKDIRGDCRRICFPFGTKNRWYTQNICYLTGTVAWQLRDTNGVRELQSDIQITFLQEKPNLISPETGSSAIQAASRAFLTCLSILSVLHRGCLLRNAQVMLIELSSHRCRQPQQSKASGTI